MLAAGARVAARDALGASPLHVARAFGRLACDDALRAAARAARARGGGFEEGGGGGGAGDDIERAVNHDGETPDDVSGLGREVFASRTVRFAADAAAREGDDALSNVSGYERRRRGGAAARSDASGRGGVDSLD